MKLLESIKDEKSILFLCNESLKELLDNPKMYINLTENEIPTPEIMKKKKIKNVEKLLGISLNILEKAIKENKVLAAAKYYIYLIYLAMN